jgi:hypothetical protein
MYAVLDENTIAYILRFVIVDSCIRVKAIVGFSSCAASTHDIGVYL